MKTSQTKTSFIIAVITLIVGIMIGYGIGFLSLTPTRETFTETKYVTIAQTPTSAPTLTTVTTATPGKVKITISISWGEQGNAIFDAAVKEYIRMNPNVEVEYLNYGANELAAVAPAQLEAGKYPAEIMVTPWSWFILELAKKGHLEDLSAYVPVSEFLPDYVKLVTYEGKVYGIPIALYFKELYWYRKSFFQAHGLTEPKTWNEFINLLDRLKNILGPKKAIIVGNGLGWPASDVVESFILAFGGAEMHSGLTYGTIKFNDQQVQTLFRDRLIPLIKAEYFSEPVEWTSAKEYWWAGEYGIYPQGSFLIPMLDDPGDADFFILPGEKPDLIGNVDFLIVPKYVPPEKKPIVFDLLRFIATKGQEIMATFPAGRVPTWTQADPNKVYPIFRELYQMAVTGQIKFVPDMDDTIGGDWQTMFWDYCKTLFTNPNIWNEMLEALTQHYPKK